MIFRDLPQFIASNPLPGWGARFPQEGVELIGCAGGFPLALPPAGVVPPIPSALISKK
ncbi:hypothetical protein JCM9152_2685 [Halalkalibacter hemicellulosilyticusJCM 9152]|uniref:Uncharacterized protein n=1 Tax=Halalkalibacter hemicellulosilyticusJCM 9152 TaxID=1236971 RepID=W4QIQ8_9BACI|nr:hypothetical protein JCM9152_2685 [Halalkalibacter hemicellulosilyticusJCM 9152]